MNLERFNFDNVAEDGLREGLKRFETGYLDYLEGERQVTDSLPLSKVKRVRLCEIFGVNSKLLSSFNKEACLREVFIPTRILGTKSFEYSRGQVLALFALVDTNNRNLEYLALPSSDGMEWQRAVRKTRLAIGENELKQYINDPKPKPMQDSDKQVEEESEEIYVSIHSGIRIGEEGLRALRMWRPPLIEFYIKELQTGQHAFDIVDRKGISFEVECLVREHINLYPNGVKISEEDILTYKRVWDELSFIRSIMLESSRRGQPINNLYEYLRWLVKIFSNRSIGLTG